MFHHAALGMITELVVFDTDRDGDTFNTSSDCNDDAVRTPETDSKTGSVAFARTQWST